MTMIPTPLTERASAVFDCSCPDAGDPSEQIVSALTVLGADDLDEQDDADTKRALTAAMLQEVVLEQMADLKVCDVQSLRAMHYGRLRSGAYIRVQTRDELCLVGQLWEPVFPPSATTPSFSGDSAAVLIDEPGRRFLTGGHVLALAKTVQALHLAGVKAGAR